MGHQLLSDKHCRSYSDFSGFKAFNSKKVRNTNISQTIGASELGLVTFESATKNV